MDIPDLSSRSSTYIQLEKSGDKLWRLLGNCKMATTNLRSYFIYEDKKT
jgi:hypothetical protein